MNKLSNPATSVARDCRPSPVRVKLLSAYGYTEETAPPDGESEDWSLRLNTALGTVSSDFVRASLLQLQGAARSPFGTISELAINAALAMIEAAAPTDELEGALAVQMACTHTAAMSVLAKMDSGFGTERRIAAFGSTAARGKHGGHFDMNWSNWRYCLKTAYRYGWRPLGTVAADPALLREVYGPVREGCQEPDYSEWDGDYFSNELQIITDDDARAIAGSLAQCHRCWRGESTSHRFRRLRPKR